MVRICRGIGQGIDVRELVFQQESTRASHASGANRITVQELLDLYRLDETLADPPPTSIAIVDDWRLGLSYARAFLDANYTAGGGAIFLRLNFLIGRSSR